MKVLTPYHSGVYVLNFFFFFFFGHIYTPCGHLTWFHGDCACLICYNDNNAYTVYLYIVYDYIGS